MKKIIVTLSVLIVMLGAVSVYVYAFDGELPFGLRLPGQPDLENGRHWGTVDAVAQEQGSLAVSEPFSAPVEISGGEILGLGDTFPLLSAASGLYTFACHKLYSGNFYTHIIVAYMLVYCKIMGASFPFTPCV